MKSPLHRPTILDKTHGKNSGVNILGHALKSKVYLSPAPSPLPHTNVDNAYVVQNTVQAFGPFLTNMHWNGERAGEPFVGASIFRTNP